HTWCTLYVKRNKDDVPTVFEVSANNVFDDNLWVSLIFRPSYSRFTRVQRLWSIVSLLFLSMIASAMFYDTSTDTSPFISMAGFELGFKEIYTGFMSSVITVPPCMIMTYIFNNRKRRGEENASIFHDGISLRSSGSVPWWSIFIAYTVLLICISAGSFFTFLYSLEWGPSLTIKWMSSFFIGTTASVLCIEPTKVSLLLSY
ncbi:polycystic kidney disease 1-related protein-like, partial [Mizuhopecten yessoensis]|uniref:polycystic kidney disease 1-related protein-like n=1 Tax=Mizuhopecten yessoensis TaxID=6573 RepID=UPI000B4578D4